MGWKVLIVWECELKKKVIDETMARIEKQIFMGSKADE